MSRFSRVEAAAVVAWAVALVLIQALPAFAHNEDLFWDGVEWATEDRNTTKQFYEFTTEVPGDANGAFADRVAEGGQKWNAIDINGPDNHFVRNGVVANYNPFGSCPEIADFKNGVHFREVPDNPVARTRICRANTVFGTDRIMWFQMIFDESHSFYTGNAQGGTSGQYDVENVSAHEFGHAVGGWIESSENGHFQSPRDGATICTTPYTSRSTMCATFIAGSNGFYGRSLESHEIHTYVQRYAPGG